MRKKSYVPRPRSARKRRAVKPDMIYMGAKEMARVAAQAEKLEKEVMASKEEEYMHITRQDKTRISNVSIEKEDNEESELEADSEEEVLQKISLGLYRFGGVERGNDTLGKRERRTTRRLVEEFDEGAKGKGEKSSKRARKQIEREKPCLGYQEVEAIVHELGCNELENPRQEFREKRTQPVALESSVESSEEKEEENEENRQENTAMYIDADENIWHGDAVPTPTHARVETSQGIVDTDANEGIFNVEPAIPQIRADEAMEMNAGPNLVLLNYLSNEVMKNHADLHNVNSAALVTMGVVVEEYIKYHIYKKMQEGGSGGCEDLVYDYAADLPSPMTTFAPNILENIPTESQLEEGLNVVEGEGEMVERRNKSFERLVYVYLSRLYEEDSSPSQEAINALSEDLDIHPHSAVAYFKKRRKSERLNEVYNMNNCPEADQRRALGEELGMTSRAVNLWFRCKRYQDRLKHEKMEAKLMLKMKKQ